MSVGGDNALSNKRFVTNGAMLAFGKTGSGTSGINGFVYDGFVSERRDFGMLS